MLHQRRNKIEKIRKFTYEYEDDLHLEPFTYYFIGTKEEFDQMRQDEEQYYGGMHYNIKENNPTQEEIEEYQKEKTYYA